MTKAKTETQKIASYIDKRGLSKSELVKIVNSLENKVPKPKTTLKSYLGKHEKIGVFSDSHIGAKEFDEQMFQQMGQTFRDEGIKKVYCVGDVLEGMSGRPGHIYELSQIGFSKQIKYAEKLFKDNLSEFEIFGINGNHDDWYMMKNNGGMDVGEELEARLDNYHHLGSMEADIEIAKGIKMRMFHPNDGTAYAISYKMQKKIESMDEDDKPDILLQGHYHKLEYLHLRGVHGVDCGTLCGQTKWMKGKKIAAHKGYLTLEMDFGKDGIGKFAPTFYTDHN